MKKELTRRQRAIRRRNRFLACCAAALITILALLGFAIVKIAGALKSDESTGSSQTENSSDVAEPVQTRPKTVQRGAYTLDAEYSELLLVNRQNPLAEDYDIEADLVEIDASFCVNKGSNQIRNAVYPYLKAMLEAAHADGVDLKVLSPYRSHYIQAVVYENQIKKQRANGLDKVQAEEKAATIVAPPGTSEHETGFAIDFNMAEDEFADTPMYTWLQKNAADYGFIMRYSAEKQPITGIIPESWHYRFVGIYQAQEINQKGVCLEEYLGQP